METSIKLYTFVDGVNDTPFPNLDNQIEINAFKYDAKRMGGAPEISATVKYSQCLDDVWTLKVYATFNGERYFLKQTPTSSFSNSDGRYTHEIELVSERVILDNVYFFDAVPDNTTPDRPVSNSTKFTFFGDIADFVERLNQSLIYSGILVEYVDGTFDGYKVFVDSTITSDEKLVSFEDKFLSEAIQEGFNTYDIPFYFKGRECHFGYSDDVLPNIFQYGVDNELLSIKKENANYKVVNRATGTGSSDNLPFYYPNNSPKGDITANAPASLGVKVVDYEKYSSTVKIDESIVYAKKGTVTVLSETISDDGISYVPYTDKTININIVGYKPMNIWLKLKFTIDKQDEIYIGGGVSISGETKDRPITDYLNYARIDGSIDADILNGSVESKTALSAGQHIIVLGYAFPYNGRRQYTAVINPEVQSQLRWTLNGKVVELLDLGLDCTGTPVLGDTITQTLVRYINPTDNLMPPIYRETNGGERFYKAENGKYKDEDGNFIVFPNPYVNGRPQEQIVDFSDIKPTIKGMKNADNRRIDMFADIAFDQNDNDETYIDESGNTMFKHPHFFVKLRKLPFNLFDHAIEDSEMVISFTSGVCGACEFKVKVDKEYPYANPVQVDSSGNLKYDDNGMVLCGVEGSGQTVQAQDIQQDTVNNEVWIALEKSEEMYGILMPKAPVYSDGALIEAGYRPKACTDSTTDDGDTFVILNISLPKEYITSAEKRLEDEIVKYILDNNVEKFNFDISFSKIYFAEHPEVLALLNENTRLNVKYNGNTYTLYVSSFTYNMTEGNALPDITVDLTETLSVSQSALQNTISAVSENFWAYLNNIDILAKGQQYFLRKDEDDICNGNINFRRGVRFSDGGKVEIDENNNTKMTIDYLEVKKKATFTSLEIQEKLHVGGQLLITPASILCSRVEEMEDAYRCYFQNFSEQGEEIFNQFAVDDMAICQTFNAWQSKYYWRLVTGVGNDYIDLSKEICDTDSDIPAAGDKIIQLGNTDDVDRQSAITLSSYGDNAPSIVLYSGINRFSLEGKNITGIVYNQNTKEPQMYSYGSMFFGDRELTKNFITFQKKTGATEKELFINANVQLGTGSSGLTNLSEWSEKQQQIDAVGNELSQMKDDGTISPQEKTSLKQQLLNINAEYEQIIADAEKYNVETDTYTSAYNAAKAALTKYTATTPDYITIEADYNNIAAYYTARTTIQDAIATATKTDISRLDELFPESNIITNGAIVAQLLGVLNNSAVIAGINGSDLGKSTSYGKLLIFGGAEGLTKLGEASTRIYEDGTIISKKLIADEGKIGSAWQISNSNLVATVDTTSGGRMNMIRPTGVYQQTKQTVTGKANRVATIVMQPYQRVSGVYDSTTFPTTTYENSCVFAISAKESSTSGTGIAKNIGFYIDVSGHPSGENYAVYVEKGQFAGFRPMTRIITATSATLTKFEYVVLIQTASACTITLPSSPELGQTFEIYFPRKTDPGYNCTLRTIDSKTINFVTNNSSGTSAAIDMFGAMKVFYNGTQWYLYRTV